MMKLSLAALLAIACIAFSAPASAAAKCDSLPSIFYKCQMCINHTSRGWKAKAKLENGEIPWGKKWSKTELAARKTVWDRAPDPICNPQF